MFKIKKNRKSQSAAYLWVYGLFTLFGLGLLYIVFNQVFVGHLVPTIKNIANTTLDNSTAQQVYTGIDRYMNAFHIVPFILFGVVVIYMFVKGLQKEGDSSF